MQSVFIHFAIHALDHPVAAANLCSLSESVKKLSHMVIRVLVAINKWIHRTVGRKRPALRPQNGLILLRP